MNTYGRYPLTISHGKGVMLYDVNGVEYLDMAAGTPDILLYTTLRMTTIMYRHSHLLPGPLKPKAKGSRIQSDG